MQRLSRRALWALARSEALASKMQDTNFLKGPICLSFLLRAMSSFQKKQANEVRAGNILEVDGRLMQVIKCSHTQGAGRQLGNVQFELRDVLSRAKRPLRLRPGDSVNQVRLEERKFQFLYSEGDTMHCMDPETFDQVAVPRDILGNAAAYLAEGGDLSLSFHDGVAVSGSLPATVTLRVAQAAPHLKGETAAPQYKAAVLETGAQISVPPFVVVDDRVVVDTLDGTFVKRA